MTKPSQRHSTHVQSTKPGEPVTSESSEPQASGVRDKGERRMWIALLLWTLVFVLLFMWLLVNLIIGLFRR